MIIACANLLLTPAAFSSPSTLATGHSHRSLRYSPRAHGGAESDAKWRAIAATRDVVFAQRVTPFY
eukprot:12428196-Karenia_brevis.AAC.1